MATHSFPFSQCAECHGADLNGVDPDSTRSCYRCHRSDNHLVAFTNAGTHPAYLASHQWSLQGYFNCHTNHMVRDSDLSFGGSCIASGCHSAPNGSENCNTCHGSSYSSWDDTLGWAPPKSLSREDTTALMGVGAHQRHLRPDTTRFSPIACQTCHQLPAPGDIAGHMGSNPGVAEVVFSGLAIADSSQPAWDHAAGACSATYCHGDANPVWTQVDTTWSGCGSCHGIPPQAHHGSWDTIDHCFYCHDETMDNTGAIKTPNLHMNGIVER